MLWFGVARCDCVVAVVERCLFLMLVVVVCCMRFVVVCCCLFGVACRVLL